MKRTCFVVIPFGAKQCLDAEGAPFTIDFDKVFESVIRPAVQDELQYECLRAKDDHAPGAIGDQMYGALIRADLVIADLSQHNPNVYYELGIRHAIRPNTTVLLKHANAGKLPFDILQLKFAPYNHENEAGCREGIDAIVRAVRAARGGAEPDSDVHRIIRAAAVAKGPITTPSERLEYAIAGKADARIGYVTGDIMGVSDIDVWVNSENTQMEMARFCELALSASIRYHGATKFVHHDTILASQDEIARELRTKAGKVMERQVAGLYKSLEDQKQRAQLQRVQRRGVQVAPHTVILTSSGALASPPNNVKLIAHVAAVQGRPTKGFFPVDDLGKCVTEVLKAVTEHNAKRRRRPLRSVLFPVFATGQAKQDPASLTDQLISAALDFLNGEQPAYAPRTVLFLAYTQAQRETLDRELSAFPQLQPASGSRGRGA